MNGEDEMNIEREAEEKGAPSTPTSESAGVIRGIPSRRIESAGVLDLRGVPAEQVAQIESIKSAGIILLDEKNSAALANVSVESAGSVVVAPSDLRVIIQPDIAITKAMVEGMPSGQKLMVVGNVFITPGVPAALVSEKFADLRMVGIAIACESVIGAMLGKLDITGVTIVLPDSVGAVVRAMGQTNITPDYLSRLEDGTTYVSVGQTAFSADVTEEMARTKIAAYHNVGQTTGPEPVLNLLKSRCGTNLGQFEVTRATEAAAEGGEVSNYSKRTLTQAFLERIDDGSSYENYGETIIAADVPEELLFRKIAKYTNYGKTIGPTRLLAVLEERCRENYGSFEEGSAESTEVEGAEAGARAGSHLENHDEMILGRAELELMADGSRLENHGELTFAEDVTPELLSQKIGFYANHGTIQAPAPLLAALKLMVLKGRGQNHGELEEC